jgi:U32 family peptidase
MELLSPAGNIEKLKYAYLYGADAVYIGLKNFSLRAKSDNFKDKDYNKIQEIKGTKKLYGALNIYFHEPDLKKLDKEAENISRYPFDAFIISDIGIVPLLINRYPGIDLHLSTQANCTNSEAAKMYRDLGFSRIILGREVSLKEIESIKNQVQDLEIEVFVHGAMCLAYSGRCFLSSWMTGRSGNKGDCAHSCRWEYRVLEEKEREGEFYPIYEGEDFTTILSSKDLNMIDHLSDLNNAGVDCIKIEGRMKSVYYTALVTRAYRKVLDSLNGHDIESLDLYKRELLKVSHREFTTGFFFGREDVEGPTEKSYDRRYLFLGTLGKRVGNNSWELLVKNQIIAGEIIEFIGPDFPYIEDRSFQILDEAGKVQKKADHGKTYTIHSDLPLREGFILRKKIQETHPVPK